MPEEFVAIDTETGGTHPTRDAVLQIGAVHFVGGEPKESFSVDVRPSDEVTFCLGALKLGGIDSVALLKERLVKGVAERDAMIQFREWFQTGLGYGRNKESRPWVVGYNLSFDINFLKALGDRTEAPVWYFINPKKQIDVLTIARCAQAIGKMPEPPDGKLASVAAILSLPVPEGIHNARVDAELVGRVFLKLIERIRS